MPFSIRTIVDLLLATPVLWFAHNILLLNLFKRLGGQGVETFFFLEEPKDASEEVLKLIW